MTCIHVASIILGFNSHASSQYLFAILQSIACSIVVARVHNIRRDTTIL